MDRIRFTTPELAAGPGGRQRGAVALSLALATAMTLLLPQLLGFLAAGLYTQDYQFLAEGAGRIGRGQVPHRDFSAPVGPLTFWGLALARRIPALGPDFLALAPLAWLVALPPAAAVALRFADARRAALFIAVAALPFVAPFNLEPLSEACDINYNGVYNRFGAGLLFITMVAVAAPRRSLWADGSLFGWLIAAMLLLKINHALAGAAILALGAVFSAPLRRAGLIAAALVVAALAVLQASLGLTSAYLADIAEMARLNAGNTLLFLRGAVAGNTLVVATAAALVLTLASGSAGPIREAWRRRSLAALLASAEAPSLAAGCLILVLWAESQSTGGVGLLALVAIAFVAPTRHDPARTAPVRCAAAAALVLLTAGTYADQIFRRGGCLLEQHRADRAIPALTALAPGLRAPASRLATAEVVASLWRDYPDLAQRAYRDDFAFGLEGWGAPVAFVAQALTVQEAVEALRGRRLEAGLRHVTTLDFADSFSAALGLEPARGLKIVLDPYRTIAALGLDRAAAYLGPVDGVFERTCATGIALRLIDDIFRAAVARDFTPVVLTPCWTLHLRRRGSPQRVP